MVIAGRIALKMGRTYSILLHRNFASKGGGITWQDLGLKKPNVSLLLITIQCNTMGFLYFFCKIGLKGCNFQIDFQQISGHLCENLFILSSRLYTYHNCIFFFFFFVSTKKK